MPYVALNPGLPELHVKVPEIIQTLSTYPISVSHGRVAAKILEKYIQNGNFLFPPQIVHFDIKYWVSFNM